ncbi:DUF1348 family protein [Synechococcus sp. UW179A]|uniref:DUF1348 family protein n=1 Tax=Synechococcus sp. UW179A TaxID=2575510 RepID=UPI000E0FA156|nr:DUF1348 family protein [Synechococcus sp. UW179A]
MSAPPPLFLLTITLETARQKVPMAENVWNSKNSEKVSLAYIESSVRLNRSEFIYGLTKPIGADGIYTTFLDVDKDDFSGR